MKIQGRHVYAVPKRVVWAALMDPSVLARTLPGCEELVADGENRFRGALTVKVGPVQGNFAGTVALDEIVPLEGFRISVHGEGPAGFMDGAGPVRVEDADVPANAAPAGGPTSAEGRGTAVVYDIDASIGGRVASVGQRLLDSTGRAITRQALEGLGRQLDAIVASMPPPSPRSPEAAAVAVDRGDRETAASPATPAPAAAPPPPSTTAFAAGVARGVVSDLVPAGQARWIAAVSAGLVVAFVLWWMLG